MTCLIVAGLLGIGGCMADVTLVDQRPLGRSTRSNPVTYVKAYDEVRRLFAAAHYGDGTRYKDIFEANRDILDNPDLIKPGQVLKLPEL